MESNENQYSERVTCSKTTKKRLMDDCVGLFLEHHPDMMGMPISQGFILKRVVEFYLE